jgi:hypothetical protein
MATTASFDFTGSSHTRGTRFSSVASFVVLAGLPLGLFGLTNLAAEAMGILPLYFSPFGLPGWLGAVGHLAQLGFLGIAFWALVQNHAERSPRLWLSAFTLAYIFLPFITPPLDSLQLAILCSSLFLVGMAAAIRVSRASALAGWLMVPTLAIVGFSATMGLVLSVAFTPPFALTQGQQPAA